MSLIRELSVYSIDKALLKTSVRSRDSQIQDDTRDQAWTTVAVMSQCVHTVRGESDYKNYTQGVRSRVRFWSIACLRDAWLVGWLVTCE